MNEGLIWSICFFVTLISMLVFESDANIGEQPLNSTSACFISSQNEAFDIELTCTGAIIAVKAVYAVAKPSTLLCPIPFDTTGDPTSECCIPQQGDCIFESDDVDAHKFCNGLSTCSVYAKNSLIFDQCDANIFQEAVSNNMFIEYYCVDESKVNTIAGTINVTKTTTGSSSYITNPGYPDGTFDLDTPSTCSIIIDDVTSAIYVHTLQRTIGFDENEMCTNVDTIVLYDANESVLLTWTCADNTYDIVTSTFTDTDIIYMVFNRNAAQSVLSQFFIGFEAAVGSATVTIKCPDNLPSAITTTTTTAKSTTMSTTTSTSTSTTTPSSTTPSTVISSTTTTSPSTTTSTSTTTPSSTTPSTAISSTTTTSPSTTTSTSTTTPSSTTPSKAISSTTTASPSPTTSTTTSISTGTSTLSNPSPITSTVSTSTPDSTTTIGQVTKQKSNLNAFVAIACGILLPCIFCLIILVICVIREHCKRIRQERKDKILHNYKRQHHRRRNDPELYNPGFPSRGAYFLPITQTIPAPDYPQMESNFSSVRSDTWQPYGYEVNWARNSREIHYR